MGATLGHTFVLDIDWTRLDLLWTPAGAVRNVANVLAARDREIAAADGVVAPAPFPRRRQTDLDAPIGVLSDRGRGR